MNASKNNDGTFTLTLDKSEASKMVFIAQDNASCYAEAALEREDTYFEGVSSLLEEIDDKLFPLIMVTSDGLTADQVAAIFADKLDMVVDRISDKYWLMDGERFDAQDLINEYEIHKEDLK